MSIFKTVFLLVFAVLPSPVKIAILRARGAKIGRGCSIGISVLNSETIELGDYVYIGHFNLIWRLKELKLQTGSKIGDGNWIAGGGFGNLFVGRNSSIRRFHFLEASGSIKIGMNSILAGRGIQMFTHGLHPDRFDDIRSITISDWCYVGALSSFVPGARIGKGTFVGLGAVVTKPHVAEYILLGGNPAINKKSLSPDSMYFNEGYLHHNHHPANYNG